MRNLRDNEPKRALWLGEKLVKTIIALAALALLGGVATASANSITVGTATPNYGNCYPFLCNDSGTSTGQSIDYQQAYASSAFGVNPYTIGAITFSFAKQFGGSSDVLSGNYDIYLGYTSRAVNGLSTNLASNVSFLTLFASFSGGQNTSPTLTIRGTPFDYNPSLGNLLLEVVAVNQANVANGNGNGYMLADTSGSVTSRAYCITNVGCFADSVGLVTKFNSVPEPMTLGLFGTGLIGLAAVRRRRKAKA